MEKDEMPEEFHKFKGKWIDSETKEMLEVVANIRISEECKVEEKRKRRQICERMLCLTERHAVRSQIQGHIASVPAYDIYKQKRGGRPVQ